MSKFKLKKGKVKLSDQEIRQQMNFNQFIAGHVPPVKGWMTGGAKLSAIMASSAVVIIAAVYMICHSGKNEIVTVTPFINPPVKSMDIPTDAFVANTDKDTMLIYSTGTQIVIPAGAFLDEEGEDVNGEIQVHYREFHDPISIMLSGIPMNYDSAGVSYQLESAGMMEISATQNGEPLHLKPGKQLRVNMISHTNNDTDYNIYSLDTLKRKWEYVSENTSANKTCFPLFERNYDAKAIDDKTIASEKIPENKPLKPLQPKKTSVDKPNFSIDFDKNEFPELAVYKGLKFEPLKGDKKYSASLSKKTWEDVVIERSEDEEHYIITFSTDKESHSFTVSPVVDEKDYAATMQEYKLRQQRYEALLAQKRKNEETRDYSLYKENELLQGEALRSNLNKRFNDFIEGSYMETSKDLLAYRTFSISKLGTWNCDRPYPFFSSDFTELKGSQKVQFVDKNNQHLFLKNTYIIRRDINTVYCVPGNKSDKFPFNKGGMDLIVGITYENQVVYIRYQEIKEVNTAANTIRVKMNAVDAGVTKPEQLRALLKI